MGGTIMKDVGGAGFAGSSPPFLGRERTAVDVLPCCVVLLNLVDDDVYSAGVEFFFV